jgi:hypothetical protein
MGLGRQLLAAIGGQNIMKWAEFVAFAQGTGRIDAASRTNRFGARRLGRQSGAPIRMATA